MIPTCAVALAGCGGSSISGLSRAKLAAKLDSTCTSYKTAAQAIAVPPDFQANPVWYPGDL